MKEGFIRNICEEYGLDEEKQKRLILAWSEIEKEPRKSEVFYETVRKLCSVRGDGEWSEDITFPFETEYSDCLKFLVLLACIEISRQELLQKGIPKKFYEDIPGHRIRPHLEKYQKTGNCEVMDFPWDRNFYTHSIFLLDRFYFIPCGYDDPLRLYRNTVSGEVVGICESGYDVAEDGQLLRKDSACGKVAFKTFWEENNEEYIGNYMNPCGFVSKEIRHLCKSVWKEVLKPGDRMLALHIPAGEGYNPQRLQNSMELALEFFATYFPEVEIKGFWSESWLYDNRLSFLLPNTSNIVSVQRCFYNYSIGGDSRMLKKEVFGSEDADLTQVRPETTLQEKVLAAFERGNDFCRTSMVVLPEDVSRIENGYPYITEEHLRELQQVVGALWNN